MLQFTSFSSFLSYCFTFFYVLALLIGSQLKAAEYNLEPTGSYSSDSYLDFETLYEDLVKYDSSHLFSISQADSQAEENGIKCLIHEGGWIDLKLFTYDDDFNKRIIYHLKLDTGSPNDYSVGTPQYISVELPQPDGSTQTLPVLGTDTKTLFESINNPLYVTKDDFERSRLKELAQKYFQDHKRLYDNPLALDADHSTLSVLSESKLYNSFNVLLAPADQSASVLASAHSMLLAASPSIDPIFFTDAAAEESTLSEDPITVSVLGSIQKEHYQTVLRERSLLPASALPVKIELELNNATFIEAKIPGISTSLSANQFFLWEEYTPDARRELTAKRYWEMDAGVLDELDTELIPPDKVKRYLDLSLHDNDNAHFQITVNPNSPQAKTHEICAPTDEKLQDPDWVRPSIDLKIGDHVSMEVAVPLNKGVAFDPNDRSHYPKLLGFPFTWMAFFAGETLYQCEPSIQPGEWRPWLGYDSQVHGAVLRRYPKGYDPKFYDWHVDTSHEDYVIFIWTAKITRRTDSTKDTYVAPYHWSKTKTLENGTLQRNNQKEGLNMEILRTWQNNTTDSTIPDFSGYTGVEFLTGMDPDEFLYLKNETGAIEEIITLSGEPWKQVPSYESENPINDIVTAYRKNRTWYVDGEDYRLIYGPDYIAANYEIQDQGTSPENPYGIKIPCKAPGNLRVEMPKAITTKLNPIILGIDASAPLFRDHGFYGNIQSPDFYPAIWESGLTFTFDLLDKTQADNYAVSFIYENEFGRRKYLNYFSSLAPEKYRLQILEEGKWTVRLPRILGFGYYSVNLWHKNPNYEASWTRIGGRELFDIDLRYLFVPTNIIHDHEFGLNENRGDGLYSFLEDYYNNEFETSHYIMLRHKRYVKPYAREYVFKINDAPTFSQMDADPHTFYHPGTDWYLSERMQAKRLNNDALDKKIHYTLKAIHTDKKSFGKAADPEKFPGKNYQIPTKESGVFLLTASYNSTATASHQVQILKKDDRLLHSKYMQGDISKTPMTALEIYWLNEAGVSLGDSPEQNWYILSIENIYSKYKYLTGPRVHAHELNQTNRFHPTNDYNDSYVWKINTANTTEVPHIHYTLDQHGPSGLTSAIINYDDAEGWMPLHFVRHTSELINGEPMPNDIKHGSISISRFGTLNSTQKGKILELFTDVPEPWQVRLPWVSFGFDANPYINERIDLPDYVTSYRTRMNIKAIYDMYAFFNNDNGAFSGNPVTTLGDDYSYENLYNKGLYLRLMSDDIKLRRGFFKDLATGRKIIVSKDVKRVNVCNAEANHIVIADSTTVNSRGF